MPTNSGTVADAVTMHLWGAQAEAHNAAFATSYIPTTTVAVTRASDDCALLSANFTSWWVAGPGTVVAEFVKFSNQGTGFSLQGGSDHLAIGNDGEGQIVDGGVNQANWLPGAPSVGVLHKYALAYATNDAAYVIDGGTPNTDATVTVPTDFTRSPYRQVSHVRHQRTATTTNQ